MARHKPEKATIPETASTGAKTPVLPLDGLLPDQVTSILQQRSQTLAQAPIREDDQETQQIPVVVFSLADEKFAVEAIYVQGIYALQELTPVPCTPNFVAGVIGVRGRILSVLDIHRFMGLSGIEINDQAQVIAVSAAGLEVGFLVKRVHAVQLIPAQDLAPTLPTASQAAAGYTRGVTPDLIILLDLEALLRDRRIIVQKVR